MHRSIAVVLLLVLAASTAAQETPHPLGLIINDLSPQRQAVQQRAEDLHVLGAILRENVESLFHIDAMHAGDKRLAVPLGEYLPDYGVVIQMRTPQPRLAAIEPTGVDKQPPSRWERTRRRLAGEADKTAVANVCLECHAASDSLYRHWRGAGAFFQANGRLDAASPTRPELIEMLVQTLGENGHNFRGLKSHERVVLSVSFDGRSDNNAFTQQEYYEFIDDELHKPLAARHGLQAWLSAGQRDEVVQAPVVGGYEWTGDLLVKQKSYTDAAKSFQRAIDEIKERPGDQGVAERLDALRVKLARAFFALGQLDQTRNAVAELLSSTRLKLTDRETIARRLALDLTGVPLPPADIKQFVENDSPSAVNDLIERLLKRSDGEPVGAESGTSNFIDDLVLQKVHGFGLSASPVESPRPPVRISVSATMAELNALHSGEMSREAFARAVKACVADE